MIEINNDWRKLLEVADANTLLLVSPTELKLLCEGWQEKYNALQKQIDSKKEPDYLKVDEVTEKLHVSKCTLWRWDRNGSLKAHKVGNKVYYRKEDIYTLLNNK